MSGSFPTSPLPRAATLRSVAPTLVSQTHAGGRQVRSQNAQRWAVEIDYPPMVRADADPLWSFILAQAGQYETFTLSSAVIGRGTPRGVATGTPVIRNRQNLLTYSDDFSDSDWVKALIAQGTSASEASPDGTDMQEWHRTDAGSTGSLRESVGTFANDNVLSIYMKAGTSSKSRINLYDTTLSTFHSVDISWAAGVATLSNPLNVDDYDVESVGDGVYRIWLYVDALTRAIVGNARTAYIYPSANADLYGCYIWRAQVEEDCSDPGYRAQTTDAAESGEDQTGRTIYTDGWTASTSAIMAAGDLIKLASGTKVYVVTADAASDANGSAAIEIEPALQATPTDGEVVTVTNVPLNVALASDSTDLALSRPSVGSLSVSMVEVT